MPGNILNRTFGENLKKDYQNHDYETEDDYSSRRELEF